MAIAVGRGERPILELCVPDNQGSENLPSTSMDRVRHAQASTSRRRQARWSQVAIVFALGCGGVVGALARYTLAQHVAGPPYGFPWSTFDINVTGSFALGFILILLIEQFPRGRLARPFLASGVIGAYTTFSTFEVDAVLLVRHHDILTAAVYVVASVIAGLLALWCGVVLARFAVRAERWLQGEAA